MKWVKSMCCILCGFPTAAITKWSIANSDNSTMSRYEFISLWLIASILLTLVFKDDS